MVHGPGRSICPVLQKLGDQIGHPMGNLVRSQITVLKLQRPPVPPAEDTSIIISSSDDSSEDTVVSETADLPPS